MSQLPALPIRVVLADDHQIVREGVRALLEGARPQGGRSIEVVGEAEDAARTLSLCARLLPDVVVLDVSLPGRSGLEVARELRTMSRRPAVVILSMHASPEHLRRAHEAGVASYVVKGSGVGVLAEAIARAAAGGEGPFPNLEAEAPELTEREREVLAKIAEGRSNREIGHSLGISVHTVNTHRVHLMEKLDVHDVATLTKLAVQLGITSE